MTSLIKRNKQNTTAQADKAKAVVAGTTFHERKCVELYGLIERLDKKYNALFSEFRYVQAARVDISAELDVALDKIERIKYEAIAGTALALLAATIAGKVALHYLF